MFKVEKHIVEASELLSKYSKYFEKVEYERRENKNNTEKYILLRKDFPIAKLSNEELRYILCIMLSIY